MSTLSTRFKPDHQADHARTAEVGGGGTPPPRRPRFGDSPPPPPSSPPSSSGGSPSGRDGSRRRSPSGYSRFVQRMKVVLPILALVLIVLVVVWPNIKGTDTRFRIGFSNFEAREAADLNMINARYMGVDDRSRPYTVTADLARNLTPGASLISLEMPKADITLEDGSWLVVTAETGRYDQPAQKLGLVGSVNLFYDMGYELATNSAFMDLKSGEAYGKEPVAGQGPFGEMRAEGFHIRDRGAVVHFTGRSHLVIHPGRINQ